MVHIDGADALGTIGQHLARVAKRAGDKWSGAGDAAVRSFVYVVVGNEAPKDLLSDMWLKSKLQDGMVFRSVQGALRDWESCIGHAGSTSIGVESSHVAVSALHFTNMDQNFELAVFPDAAGTGVGVDREGEQPPSPSLASRAMRNREGSFSPDMRARQGSFHL